MKVPVILAVLCLTIGYGHSCKCPKIPTNGCKSQYSILGTVLGALPIGIPPEDERIYTVFVHRIYKVFINLETIP
uniref:Uncharacterized protein n=1 Tax=Magallana gigas TaxID=29159 RepID=A0A8W8LM72_MAGGI